MAGRSLADRAALSINAARLGYETSIRIDLDIMEQCEAMGIFKRKSGRKRIGPQGSGTGLSQWIYIQMIRAIKEELAKKGLTE